jgi:hypothetical protein
MSGNGGSGGGGSSGSGGGGGSGSGGSGSRGMGSPASAAGGVTQDPSKRLTSQPRKRKAAAAVIGTEEPAGKRSRYRSDDVAAIHAMLDRLTASARDTLDFLAADAAAAAVPSSAASAAAVPAASLAVVSVAPSTTVPVASAVAVSGTVSSAPTATMTEQGKQAQVWFGHYRAALGNWQTSQEQLESVAAAAQIKAQEAQATAQQAQAVAQDTARRMEELRRCMQCKRAGTEHERTVVCFPCGHVCWCASCANQPPAATISILVRGCGACGTAITSLYRLSWV